MSVFEPVQLLDELMDSAVARQRARVFFGSNRDWEEVVVLIDEIGLWFHFLVVMFCRGCCRARKL